MKIGVIGSGQVGETLANGLLKHGHKVMRGSRTPEKLRGWLGDAGEHASTGTVRETATFGELVILAVKGTVAVDVVRTCAQELAGKTVIDPTNPIADEPPDDGVIRFFTDSNESLMERLQTAVPEASFVKAFSSVGNALMIDPHVQGGPPSMFICGNDAAAKANVGDLLRDVGWEVEDMGTVKAARAIEPLCILWCIPGFINNDWMHAFKVVRSRPIG